MLPAHACQNFTIWLMLERYPKLNDILFTVLFTGKNIAYSYDNPAVSIATMLGFIKNENGSIVVANRIFETRLYNRYLSLEELQSNDIYRSSLWDRNLEDYHKSKGYMLSFCFNKKKKVGVQVIVIGDKTVIEAIV